MESDGRNAARAERRYEVLAGVLTAREKVLPVQVVNARRFGGTMGFRKVQFRVKEAVYSDRMWCPSGLHLDGLGGVLGRRQTHGRSL